MLFRSFLDRYWARYNSFYMFPRYSIKDDTIPSSILKYVNSKYPPMKERAVLVCRDGDKLKVCLFLKESRSSFVKFPLPETVAVKVFPLLFNALNKSLYSFFVEIDDDPARPFFTDIIGRSSRMTLGNDQYGDKLDWSPELFLAAEHGEINLVVMDESNTVLLKRAVPFSGVSGEMMAYIKSEIRNSPAPAETSSSLWNTLVSEYLNTLPLTNFSFVYYFRNNYK